MLAPPIALLINSSPLENGSRSLIVALMVVLAAYMSRLSKYCFGLTWLPTSLKSSEHLNPVTMPLLIFAGIKYCDFDLNRKIRN